MKEEGRILKKWRNADIAWGGFCSVAISIIALVICIVASFLFMLFQSGEDGYRTCFFDTVYFESVTDLEGAVSMNMGLTGEYLPFVAFLVVFFVFSFGVFYIAKMLLMYKQKLIDERKK